MTSCYIGDRKIGGDAPCYIIAELSCNHEGDLETAKQLILAAYNAGADAVKLQTYTANTLSRDFDYKPQGTLWDDINLHDLYDKAQTPWDWFDTLSAYAASLNLQIFSSPFDETAVDFLMKKNVPAFKIASFEAIDLKLLEKVAKTGKTVILSNGMTDFDELAEAIHTLRKHNAAAICITHCNSGYPASFDDANLKTIPEIAKEFNVVVGLSDHTLFTDHENQQHPMAHITPVEAVKFGAKMIEVHLLLDREKAKQLHSNNEGGFDWAFSRNPAELKKMVDLIRQYEQSGEQDYPTHEERLTAERTHGSVCFEPTERERVSRQLRPSLWAVKAIKQGEPFIFAAEQEKKPIGNFDSIRPSGGLAIKHADEIEGKLAALDIDIGQPLTWEMIEN